MRNVDKEKYTLVFRDWGLSELDKKRTKLEKAIKEGKASSPKIKKIKVDIEQETAAVRRRTKRVLHYMRKKVKSND